MGSKVYEASTLKAATRERAQQYVRLKEQFETLKKEFRKIVDNTEFQGHGAEAIKGFYLGQIDVVDAWILFIDMNVEFFNRIPGDMKGVDLSEDTVVQVPFLEDSVEQAGRMAKEMVADQQGALRHIFNGINDLVPLTVFSKDAFDNHMDQAEKKRVQTVDKVNELDNRLSQEYASSRTQEQHIFALFSQLMEATRQGENISPLYFNAEAYHSSKAYQVYAETIGIATSSVKQGENGQAPQIEIKNNEVQNPGDVAVVKTVEVFDEIEGKTNGTYYLYENGQIIWKHPTQTGKVVYKEVDEVPESRVGGVEELDSAFDGTGLAFLGWLHPKDVLKKSVKLVIKKGGKTTVKKLSKKEIKKVSAKRFVYDEKTGTWVDKNGKPLVESTNKSLKGNKSVNKDIKEIDYGKHYKKGKYGRRELAPQVRYVTEDGYKYRTDDLGRIVDVEADKLILKDGKRNESMQRVAGRQDRLRDDDGGHIIGSQFHGSGDIDNLVAQNSQINRSGGEWYKMETQWANALKEIPPKKVSVKIEPVYSGNSLRPNYFEVIYKIEGKRPVKKTIKNQSGG